MFNWLEGARGNKKGPRKTWYYLSQWLGVPATNSGNHESEQHRAQCTVTWSPGCHSPSLLLQTGQLGALQPPGSLSDNLRAKLRRWKCEARNGSRLFKFLWFICETVSWLPWGNQGFQARLLPLGLMFLCEEAPLGGEPSPPLSYMPLGINITCLIPCMVWLRKKRFQECQKSKFLCLFQDFPCKGMLKMPNGRVAAWLWWAPPAVFGHYITTSFLNGFQVHNWVFLLWALETDTFAFLCLGMGEQQGSLGAEMQHQQELSMLQKVC